GAREAAAIGDRVRAGALDGHAGVVSVQAAVEAMEESMGQVSRGVGGLSDYVAATTHAMGEMAAAFEDVSRKGSELERAMEAAIGDVDTLGEAGRDAQARLAHLESLAEHAGNTLGAVKASMSTLERAASESEATAELVAQMSERAGGVVEETVHGIESLRAAVADAHRRVAALGRRSDDIDQVVDFIAEVAGRTNLLSLNASIIASQAGEHGKAFSVVADQIRELAAQIARSTKSIGDIIHSVREDVEGTAALIDRGDALAVDGVQLARNSLEALGQIRRSTAQGRETAAAIHAAVDAHGRSSREVSQLVESVANGSRAVSAAVQLVGRSVAGVNSVSKSVKAMAEQVARALEEQAGLGRRQIESLARLERMIGEITRAVQNHDAATRRVRDALQDLSQTAGEHESAVEGLSGVAERLGSRARALAESVGRFKV
ncbi:MAG TPA: methyl-accepting chemotaxis protein, partial [Anaeromyxobacter sp.]